MAEIILVRHGQTASNIDFLLHGRTDVPLTPAGRAQARAVAERLSELGEFAHLYSSPLQRASVTAGVIGKRLGLRPVFVPELTELDFGDFEGMTLQAIHHTYPELFERVADADDHDFRFPRGETRREFNLRVRNSIETLAARHSDERLIVVAHGGVIASAIAQFTGEAINDWARWLVDNCSITQMELGPAGHFRLVCWNETDHLDRQPARERSES